MQWNTWLLHCQGKFFFSNFNFIYRRKDLRYRDRAPDIFLNKLYTSIFSVIELKHWYLPKLPNLSSRAFLINFVPRVFVKIVEEKTLETNLLFSCKKYWIETSSFPKPQPYGNEKIKLFFFHTKIVLCRRGGNGFNKRTTVLFKLNNLFSFRLKLVPIDEIWLDSRENKRQTC